MKSRLLHFAVLAALLLCGCATTSLTKDDLASTRKYFTGTLMDKQIMELDRAENGAFGGRSVKGTYLRLAVADDTGATRYFYSITEKDDEAAELKATYYSLLKGDRVQLDLGFIDANSEEEEFESLTKL